MSTILGRVTVILSFAEQFSDILAIGYDFSLGMLHKAKEKDLSDKVIFIMGDAASLSFADDYFDIVCCSHALYELKGQDREKALFEMARVVKPNGRVLIMERTFSTLNPMFSSIYLYNFQDWNDMDRLLSSPRFNKGIRVNF